MIKAHLHHTYIFLLKNLALNYLSLLASKAAAMGNRDVATTSQEFSGILFHDVRNVKGEVATAVLEANLPVDLASLDPVQLGEFRSIFAASRLKYQANIQDLVTQYEKVSSERMLGQLKRQLVEIATQRIEETTVAYRKGKIEVASRALAITLTPSALAAFLASALGVGHLAPVSIAAALSLFAAQVLFDRRKARLERERSGWSYIFDVRNLRYSDSGGRVAPVLFPPVLQGGRRHAASSDQ